MKNKISGLILFLFGCNTLVVDKSINAIDAFDYTLALNAGCSLRPGDGADICRVHEGDPIDTVWRAFLPKESNGHLGGEVTVNYKTVTKTYAVAADQKIVEIPLNEFFESDHWIRADHNGVMLALVALRFKDAQNIEYVQKVRGMAIYVVMVPNYNPLPFGSGFAATEDKVECRYQYSTAGRVAIKCK